MALLTPRFRPEWYGGSERIFSDLAQGLIARGHAPRLITSHAGPSSTAVEDGLPVTRNWRPPDGRLQRRRYEDHLTHVPFSYRSLMRGDQAIAHAIHVSDGLAVLRWSRKSGRPAVLTYPGVPDRRTLLERRRRLEITERVMRGCTVVTLSRAAADAAWRWLGVEARVVYPSVDLAAFEPAAERAENPTILSVSASRPADGQPDPLLRAFRLVRREQPAVRLRLLRPRGSAIPTPLEAEPGVSLVEPVEQLSDLGAEYGRAWVSALPSGDGAQGVVLLESLACGTPVVATQGPALEELLDGKAVGKLYSGDERALADALLTALERPPEPGAAEACRARAADFPTERATEEYLSLYRELL